MYKCTYLLTASCDTTAAVAYTTSTSTTSNVNTATENHHKRNCGIPGFYALLICHVIAVFVYDLGSHIIPVCYV